METENKVLNEEWSIENIFWVSLAIIAVLYAIYLDNNKNK